MVGDEFREPVFVDRGLAGVDRVDDLLVDVDVDDLVAEVGETRRDGRADVAAADDADVHTGG